MTDYIKREDALELFEMVLDSYKDAGIQNIKTMVAIAPQEFHLSEDDGIADFNFELDGWRNDFMKIEPADVAPVRHGRWEKEYGYYKCLLCNSLDDFADNYCPNCGARMDGDGNEID